MSSFSFSLRDEYLARIERERLNFELERSEANRSERAMEREERREERASMQELDLSKYRLMLETVTAAIRKK